MKDRINTIIFDMDGTLIDTEKYFRICWPKALEDYGYHMTDEQALSMRSLGRPFAPAHLKKLFGEEFDYDRIRNHRKVIMEEYLKKYGIQLKPGAMELLQFLKERRITAAIATASDLERTNRYLGQVGVLDYFDKLISATSVKEGKPAPDIYLYACEQLGKKPSECYAVEDSPNGVMSAYRAGCKVIMIPDQTEPDEELCGMLAYRLDSLNDIRSLFLQQEE